MSCAGALGSPLQGLGRGGGNISEDGARCGMHCCGCAAPGADNGKGAERACCGLGARGGDGGLGVQLLPGMGTWACVRSGAWPWPLVLAEGSRLLEAVPNGGLLSGSFFMGSVSAAPAGWGCGQQSAPRSQCMGVSPPHWIRELGVRTYLPPHPGWAAWGLRGWCRALEWCLQSPVGRTTGPCHGAEARPALRGCRAHGGGVGYPPASCCSPGVLRTGGSGSSRSSVPSAPDALAQPPLLSQWPPTRPLTPPAPPPRRLHPAQG